MRVRIQRRKRAGRRRLRWRPLPCGARTLSNQNYIYLNSAPGGAPTPRAQAEYERMMYHLLGRPVPEPTAETEAPPPPTAEPPPPPVQGQRRRRRRHAA